MPQDDPMPCAVEGCDRPAHGGSPLCSTHKARRVAGKSLSAPVRHYERNPEERVHHALEQFLESREKRRQQLDAMLKGDSELRQLIAAFSERAEVAAEDDEEWERAQARLRQALSRYRRGAKE